MARKIKETNDGGTSGQGNARGLRKEADAGIQEPDLSGVGDAGTDDALTGATDPAGDTAETTTDPLAGDPAITEGTAPDEPLISDPNGSINSISIAGETYVLTFNDEFRGSAVSFWDGHGKGGLWSTSFSPHLDDTRFIAANNELQYYLDPDMTALPNPFDVGDGLLTITASALDAAQQTLAEGQSYSSGMIATEMSFGTDAGYIEMRADLPAQTGLWSAFWLMPVDDDWSAELDIVEVLGEDAGTLHTNVWDHGVPNPGYTQDTGAGEGFHDYGVYWDDSVIQWYFDDQLIRETANTIHEEMYLIINLAVGGWAEDPDATTDLSDGISVDYVRVYELETDPDRNARIDDGTFVSQELKGGTTGDDVINGSRWGDVVTAQDGADIVYGKEGDDALSGGAGDDRLYGQAGSDVLQGGDGNDHLSGGTGADRLTGGAGTDHLWGGTDSTADVFVFGTGSGTDYVHDFEVGTDRIDLGDLSWQLDTVLSQLDDQGWATRIDLAAGGGASDDAVYLVGLSADQVTADIFETGLFV